MAGSVIIKGIYGAVQGQKFCIKEGQAVILGRSRSCDICLHSKLNAENSIDEHASKHFQTISRKHLKITFHSETSLEVEDLSANGSLLDGEKMIDKIFLSDITTDSHTLLLGSREKILLEWELY